MARAVPDQRHQTRVHALAPAPEMGAMIAGGIGGIEHVLDRDRIAQARIDLLDVTAQLLEREQRRANDGCDLVVDPQITEVGAEGDAQPRNAIVEAGDIVLGRGRQAHLVAVVRSGHDLEHQRGIADRAADRAGVRHVVVVVDREVGHPPVGRLEAEDAAECGRHADRAGAVRALMDRADARGRADRGAGARAAGVHAVLPGVVRDAGERAVTAALPAELGDGGLPDRDRARRREALDERRVDVRDAFGIDPGARHGPHALAEREVLDRGRHAMEGPERVAAHHRLLGLARPRPCRVCGPGTDRVEPGIERLGPREHRVHDLDRGDRFGPDQAHEFDRRRVTEVRLVHVPRLRRWEPAGTVGCPKPPNPLTIPRRISKEREGKA
jgi:hypothetical protein